MTRTTIAGGVLALVLAACGGATGSTAGDELPRLESGNTSSPTTTEPSEPTEADQEAAMAEYEKCMGDLGVDVGDLVAGGGSGVAVEGETVIEEVEGDFDPAEFEAAAAQCDELLTDAFGEFEVSPEQEAEIADQMLELEKCLAEAGYEIDMSGQAFEVDPSIDFEEFQQALDSCQTGVFGSFGETP